MTEIWHNPRCSKSRQTLSLIEDRNPVIRKYLDDAPSVSEIKAVLGALGMTADQIIRRNEPPYKELGLASATQDALIAAMAEHPILIERPIVIKDRKAAIGRPPEAVLALFTKD